MATSNKAISAYLPPDIEEYLTQYCTEYDITRKDKSGDIKPALGTAVVEILKVFFSSESVPSPLPDNVPVIPSNVVTEDRLQEVISNLPSTVPSNVNEQIEKAMSEALPKMSASLGSDEKFISAIASKLPA